MVNGKLINHIEKAGSYCQLFLLLLLLKSCGLIEPTPGKQLFIDDGYSHKIVDGYWIYLPKSHNPNKTWPVILFLQGGYGASPNPKTSENDGPVKFVFEKDVSEELYQYVADSFIIINPHMRAGPKEKRQWYQYSNTLNQIVDEVIDKHQGDKTKIYLTGLSRGGTGSWELAKQYPDKFAAVLPISGIVTCKSGCNEVKSIPIWIVHNKGDEIINIKYPRSAIAYLEENGRNFFKTSYLQLIDSTLIKDAIYTEFNEDGHNAWNKTYASPKIYKWLLTHSTK